MHFLFVYRIFVVDYLKLKGRGKNVLLEFIRAVLPKETILNKFKTYSRLMKIFDLPQIDRRNICGNCGDTLNVKQKCLKPECINIFEMPNNINKGFTTLTEFNFYEDLKLILNKYWKEIAQYKATLATSNLVSDALNTISHKSKQIAFNTISLILFIDGAAFTNTGKESTWGIFAFIADLPPRIRNSFYNVLKIVLINSSLFSFNAIFEKQMKNFKELIKNGIQIGNTQFHIKIHSFIADCLGRTKLCNSKQFNGYFGCLHCLNRGVRVGRSHCYPGIDAPNRTTEDYERQVKDSSYGIKGPSFLSEFISIPDDVIIDDMHLVDEGSIKQFLNLWFLPKNHRSPFYLLRNIHGIDKILKQVKYPHEVNKRQRTLTAYVHYNANEFRSLATYPLIYILQNQFKEKKYYYNLVKYLLFLRLLRQDFVPDIDINNSQILINSFLEEFQELYGTKNLSYNMHANLHLPKQVRKHGSLPKQNAYPGENCFKEMNLNYQGTTNIPFQIATNISIKNHIKN